MGDHPEDEDDFYEDEMDVRISPAPRGGERAGGHCIVGWPLRPRWKESIGWQVYVFESVPFTLELRKALYDSG